MLYVVVQQQKCPESKNASQPDPQGVRPRSQGPVQVVPEPPTHCGRVAAVNGDMVEDDWGMIYQLIRPQGGLFSG